MTKKKGRYLDPKPLPPDDPIFQQGLQIYTPLWARPGYQPPEPNKPPVIEAEPPKE